MIAANLAAERVAAAESVALTIFAVEADANSYQELENNAAPYRPRGVRIETRKGEWIDHIREIVEVTSGDPVLLFVDPFGLSGVRFATLDPLIGRQTPTDVIVRLHDPAVYRNANQYPELISEGLGTTNWKHGWSPRTPTGQKMAIARSAFRHSIEDRMSGGATAVSYPVRRRLGGSSDYTLFYASRRADGVELWHEELGRHFRSLHQTTPSTTSQASFLPEVTLEIRQAQLKELIRGQIFKVGGATGQELIKWMRLEREDFVMSSEVGESLKSLEGQGLIAREGGERGYKNVRFVPSTPPSPLSKQSAFQL